MNNPEQIKPLVEKEVVLPQEEKEVLLAQKVEVDRPLIEKLEKESMQLASKELEQAFGEQRKEKEELLKELNVGSVNTAELVQSLSQDEFFKERQVPVHFQEFLKHFSKQLGKEITPLDFCNSYEHSLSDFMNKNWEKMYNEDLKLAGLESEGEKKKAIEDGFLMDDNQEKVFAMDVWKEHIAETAKEFFPGDFADRVAKILEVMGYKQGGDMFRFKE